MRLVRGFFAWVVVVSTLVTGGAAITPAEERSCLPAGGHAFTLESDTSTLTVTAHASLYTRDGAPGALGLGVDGVSHDQTTLVYRTGVVRDPGTGFSFAFDAGARFPTKGSERAIDVDHGRVDGTIDPAC
ncbi:hypothetical protein ACFO0N_18685 [Halobium salinum]|uniref:Uncharacterized protein n=1 Tax=Halobium salinum TaxID=1364940 RepID=A0ABD5PGJ6_9EURY|nr:hypothetical protein [Halobium salinum]